MTGPGVDPFRRVVLPLAVAQVLAWAAMFYSFPALLLEWERNLGWSKTELSGAFTLSLVVSAVLAPVVGRLIDHGLAPIVFTGCALFGALMLALMSMVTELWQFYLTWLGLGVAMSGMLYEACFAVLTRALGAGAKRAITLITLIGGFAGTVSFPAAYALVGLAGWRGAVLTFGFVVAFAVVPLNWRGVRAAEQGREVQTHATSASAGEALRVLRKATFWLLAIAFSMTALEHGILLTHLLPLLDDRGFDGQTAILAAAMIGPMQVVGRIALITVGQRGSNLGISIVSYAALGIAAWSLLGARAIPVLLVVFVLFQGAGYGLTSIIRPVVTADYLGRANFGVISGFIALPFFTATAVAPTIAAFVWERGGYDRVIEVALYAAGVGLASLLVAALLNAKRSRGSSGGGS